MQNFIFQNATKVYFGKGCVKEYLACLLRGSQRVLLAYGGGSIKANGVYGQVMGILSATGKTVVEFADIRPNPTYAKVQQGAALAREEKVDIILGIGGGSVIDCCKAVAMAAVYPGDIWDDFWARPGVVDFEPLPLGVIVTVAGTGSECNGGAVITNEEKKIKTGRDYPACNPRFALMDPTYTLSLPKEQMVSGGFDILSHIMEAYFSWPDEDNVSDDIAEALMQGVIRDLRASVKDPQDYTARSNLMWESAMAENRITASEMRQKCRESLHAIIRAPAGGLHRLQPRPGAGSAASGLLPPHLRAGETKIRPLCHPCLGHSGRGEERGRAGPCRGGSTGRFYSGAWPAHYPAAAGPGRCENAARHCGFLQSGAGQLPQNNERRNFDPFASVFLMDQ